jgi:DNA-binding LacI/PurR family transcriptional regulator/DNA-binding GntR family transcriptional regulator
MNDRSMGPLGKAIAFLATRVESGLFAPGVALPPVRRLCRDAGVSYVTMWKAVARLRREGVLSGQARHRPMVPAVGAADGKPTRASAAVGAGATWAKVSQTLRAQILGGQPHPGEVLPLSKELCRVFGVGPATMRRALHELCRTESVAPYGRGYRVSPLAASLTASRVALLLSATPSGYLALGELDTEYVRVIESECARAGVTLDIYSYDPSTATDARVRPLSASSPADPRRSELGLGCIVLLREAATTLAAVLASAASPIRPVAVLDVAGVLTAPLTPTHPLLRVFSLATSDKPGLQMGRYLAGLGHRRIAYLSPYHRQSWSQMRLAGLARALADAGGGADAVTVFVSAGSMADEEPFRLRAERLADFGALRRSVDAWADSAPPAAAAQARDLAQWGLPSAAMRAGVNQEVGALCEQALADPLVTAWVFPNDNAALMGLRYLDGRSVAVPARLSVAGFDDAAESVRRRLTSYSFNLPALIAAMLRHVLSPGVGTGSARRVVIDGHVVPRQSTAAAVP